MYSSHPASQNASKSQFDRSNAYAMTRNFFVDSNLGKQNVVNLMKSFPITQLFINTSLNDILMMNENEPESHLKSRSNLITNFHETSHEMKLTVNFVTKSRNTPNCSGKITKSLSFDQLFREFELN